ncbi:hypothetical protein PMI12_04009 [Variovorax sp. CF313]|uniref:hypothetical protein n=1 Tax=Variovorax sp. CF313 TaxID=1144315 RepID=UPI000270E489|nr:hypothetical protein [Variovorax sp. CF313]EJL72268.1 hypothetical protein PMI12_04009 [Variovorax sp. CF313]
MNDQIAPGEDGKAEEALVAVQEHASEDQVLPPQPNVPKTIVVVDDELFRLTNSHVRRWAPDFYETIEDVNDPAFGNLWEVARAVPELGAADWDIDAATSYFASEAAISSVLLSQQFLQIAQPRLRDLLGPFTGRAKWVTDLKQVFKDAFQAPDFDLQFVPVRPSFADIGQCAVVFLDLFLEQGEASPVAAVQAHLRQLATDADDAVLPPLVLMSSHPELEQYKLGFSEHAGISAAGLMVLPKAALMEPEFRAAGLKLAFKQLDRQKHVAHALRRFMASWLEALETAKANTARTLWNLDASAMQQIHLASISDDDPYDEHLNEFLSREHLFHVEAQAKVAASVAELDKQFRAQLTEDGQIENRLISPLADVKTARAFVSHFTWFGSSLPASFMGDEAGAASRISRTLPFGSVLVQKQVGDGSRCLVHITQQCDLNAISRSKDASCTLTFAIASAIELQAASNPVVKTTELVAKSLRIGQGADEREFDLRINVGELLAMPLREFLERTRTEDWRVVGRLRSDITNHIVAATTNHMSRPASQKMIRPGLLRSKVFLQSAVFNGAKEALIDKDSSAAQKPAKIFSVLRDEGRYSFEDSASIEIALWLVHHSTAIGLALDGDQLCAALRRGWTSPVSLPGGLRIRVRECESLAAAFRGLRGGDIAQGDAQLTIIFEK